MTKKLIPIIEVPYGKVSERCIVCGDPKRAERISKSLDNVEVVSQTREYWTYNGTYKGVPITVSSHGVGAGGASVLFEGLILGGAKVLIRVGTCGTLQREMPQGSLILATAACREDGVTDKLIPSSYPAVASYDVVYTMKETAEELGIDLNIGIITTWGPFYAGYMPSPNVLYSKVGVLAMENEASSLFVISSLRGVKSGCIVASDGLCFELVGAEEFDHHPEAMDNAMENQIELTLESIIKVEV